MWLALVSLAPLLAIFEIRAERARVHSQIYLLKPLTTGCILLIALLTPPPFRPGYHIPIVLGLFFSLFGDVFLMLRRERFLAALFTFLVAHVCYIIGFTNMAGAPRSVLGALVLGAYGIYLLKRLWSRLGGLRWAVVLYASVLLVMAASAWQMLWQLRTSAALLALAGAVLFVVSDSLLALDRFEGDVEQRRTVVLATYFAAQWLIALSV